MTDRDPLVAQLDRLPFEPLSDGTSLYGRSFHAGVPLWHFADFQYYHDVRTIAKQTAAGGPVRLVPWPIEILRRSRLLLAVHHWQARRTAALGKRFDDTRSGPAGAPRVLFTAQNRLWGEHRDLSGETVGRTDRFLAPIYSALDALGRTDRHSIYPLSGPEYPTRPGPDALRIARERQDDPFNVRHHTFGRYWTPDTLRIKARTRAHFERQWRTVSRDSRFREFLNEEPKAQHAWRRLIRYLYTAVFPRMSAWRHIARNAIRTLRPDVLFVVNEYGRFERALWTVAQDEGIPVLAIQHGAIIPESPGYTVHPAETEASAREVLVERPFPDLTAVFGDHDKDVLVATCGYPPERVVATGQPRYDVIPRLRETLDREAILKQIGADPSTRTVLWTTQAHYLPTHENQANREAVFDALAAHPDLTLIIKPHPQETDLTLHRADDRCTPVIAGPQHESLPLIGAADVVITKDSTTGMEAVALHKPLLVLNLSGAADRVDYVKDGVAMGAYSKDNVPRVLDALLADGERFQPARERYIREHLHKLDGKASERIARLILDVAERDGPESHQSTTQ